MLSTSSCATLAKNGAGSKDKASDGIQAPRKAPVTHEVGAAPRLGHAVGVMRGVNICIRVEGMLSLRRRRWGAMEMRDMFIRQHHSRRRSRRCMLIADEWPWQRSTDGTAVVSLAQEMRLHAIENGGRFEQAMMGSRLTI